MDIIFVCQKYTSSYGSIQLKKLDKIIQERLDILNIYKKNLSPLGFKNQKISNFVKFNVQSATFMLQKNLCKENNKDFERKKY